MAAFVLYADHGRAGSREPVAADGNRQAAAGMESLSWDKEVSKLLREQAELMAKGEGAPEEFARICSDLSGSCAVLMRISSSRRMIRCGSRSCGAFGK